MSSYDVTLTSATRQNLLSLQDTASLVATNQTRLSTGKKVNSALDNPVNYFTSQSLTSRSTALSGILDGISNGIQSIQAANQGITSVQKLIDSAKSLATQALASKSLSGGSTTATTAAADYVAPTGAGGTAFTFSVDGVSKTVTLPQGSGAAGATANPADAQAVISALNNAAGTTAFSLSGNKISVGSTTNGITFDTTNGALIGIGAGVTGTNGTDATRTSLAKQYNSLLTQIDQLANDASYNGVNLINSSATTNKLHVSFNEKDTSGLDVQGVNLTSSGLGMTAIPTSGAGSNFQSDTDVNAVLTKITTASNTLSAQASTFGSNLTVVQNRQDFSKQLINVLQTGSDNLTNADMNAEAANSQALSTRQSLGISALSLANTAQQGILQLLR